MILVTELFLIFCSFFYQKNVDSLTIEIGQWGIIFIIFIQNKNEIIAA